MKINHRYISILLLACLSFSGYSREIYNRGLRFCSFEVDQDKRTSLNLTPSGKLDLPNGFTLSFDIQLRKQDQNFGYVFRIIGKDSTNIDLVSDFTSNEYLFSLVSGMKSLIKVQRHELKDFREKSWIKITLRYNLTKKTLSLHLNNYEKTVPFNSLKLGSVDVLFGLNRHPLYATTDVPPMTIRDILIYNEKNVLMRNWKLEKHSTDKVYDECDNHIATCLNPVWEIDSHVKWQQCLQMNLPYPHPQFAFDEVNERLFIVKGRMIKIYYPVTGKMDSLVAAKGEAYNCMANQLVYNGNANQLISYSFDNTQLAVYDFTTNTWTNENSLLIAPQFWHHSKFFDKTDSTVITIGGYGYHKYKADVMRYSLKNKEWKQHDISTNFPPRYLGSLGLSGKNELLYFGGYGSKTGNQEEFPRNYYDLYKINSKTLEVTKLWELNNVNEHFANSNSLIINNDKGVFYNLSYSNTRYNTAIKLVEYNIEKPEFSILGDSIPYKFKDVESYCDLFYCPKSSKLIAITSVSKNNKSEVSVYSIAYPPLRAEDVLQEEVSESLLKWYYWLIVLIIVPFWIVYKRRKQSVDYDEIDADIYMNVTSEIELKPSSINLLGSFQIVDKDGVNITGSFSPIITQMLLLIILYTVKNGQGISSQELTDILWYDKDGDSARNNRNVNISKLRLLLKNVGEIELINTNSTWSVNIGKDVFCDYRYTMLVINSINKQKTLTGDIIGEFLNIASSGPLLPNFHEECFDDFKGNYTNTLIETLTKLTQRDEVKNNFGLLLRISEVILLQDNIDEDAAKLKVYALYNLGKKGQAKQYYQKFMENYKTIMGSEYKDSFEQFAKRTS